MRLCRSRCHDYNTIAATDICIIFFIVSTKATVGRYSHLYHDMSDFHLSHALLYTSPTTYCGDHSWLSLAHHSMADPHSQGIKSRDYRTQKK